MKPVQIGIALAILAIRVVVKGWRAVLTAGATPGAGSPNRKATRSLSVAMTVIRILVLSICAGACADRSVPIEEQMGPQSFSEPNVPVAGGEDAEILSAVEAAVSVASKLGFRSDASESAHGRVVVQALWHGRPVTLTMRFFRRAKSAQHEGRIYIASSLSRPGDVAASGGRKIEQLYYSRLSEETAWRGFRIYGDQTARP